MAEILYVPDDADSIQEAVDIASDGDEIVVAAGTYFEAIDLDGKAVTLMSESGPEKTIIDATGQGTSVITCSSGEGSDTVIEGFTITGGTGQFYLGSIVGGGMFNKSADPTVRNCVFTENMADGTGGAICNFFASPLIEHCTFLNNSAGTGDGGGAISNNGFGTPAIQNCRFIGNDAVFVGGAISNLNVNAKIINCLFTGNNAAYGGAIRNSAASPHIINCTIVDNTAQFGGGMRSSSPSEPIICNTILWDNVPDDVSDVAGANTVVSNSNIMTGWNGEGIGNISADPGFVDVVGPDGEPATGDEDLRLSLGSPSVETGNNDLVPQDVDADIDGEDRFFDADADNIATADMGAFEVQTASNVADIDDNGIVDGSDLLALLASWGQCPGEIESPCAADLNDDGFVDTGDLLLLFANWGWSSD